MAIQEIQFRNGLFTARFQGQISRADAEFWLVKLHQHAMDSVLPLVSLVDLRRAEFISTAARMTLAEATRSPLMFACVIAAKERPVLDAARAIRHMAVKGHLHVLPSLQEARWLAEQLVHDSDAAVEWQRRSQERSYVNALA